MDQSIFVFVEGENDARFFEIVLKPLLLSKYSRVVLYQYQCRTPKKVNNYIRSLKNVGTEYIFVRDLDSHPCITSCKKKVLKKLSSVQRENIRVVLREIESWYVAGMDERLIKRVKGTKPKDTSSFTKEALKRMMSKKFHSEVDYLQEILKSFSLEAAIKHNRSLRYFVRKSGLEI